MAVREFSDSASISDCGADGHELGGQCAGALRQGNGALDPQGTATRAEVAQAETARRGGLMPSFCLAAVPDGTLVVILMPP